MQTNSCNRLLFLLFLISKFLWKSDPQRVIIVVALFRFWTQVLFELKASQMFINNFIISQMMNFGVVDVDEKNENEVEQVK